MIQVMLILAVGAIVARDALVGGGGGGSPGFWVGAASVWLPIVAIMGIAHGAVAWCGWMLDRSGLARHVINAERVVTLSRWAVFAAYAWGVLGSAVGGAGGSGAGGGDWVGAARSVTGDVPALDEALILLPLVLGFASLWASYASIDRRLREASLVGVLDGVEPALTLPTRWQYTMDQVRHQVLIVILPILLITLWSESLTLAVNAVHRWRPDLLELPWMSAAVGVAHFLGIVLALVLMPLGMRYIWNTSVLGAGPLRERLESLCRLQRVRCRDYLVWHTHTGMVNGALVGLLPRLRYILLTEALLERLTGEQVEAVMAHEAGHAARRHIPWLGASVIATVVLTSAGLGVIAGRVLPAWMMVHLPTGEVVGPEFPLSLAAGILVFGWVSRLFERQADAFAAQHLSGWSPRRKGGSGERGAAPVIDANAVEAMCGALSAVARIAHLPERRFTFRHGSIAARKANLRTLTGVAADRLAVDTKVRLVKVALAAGVLAAIAVLVFAG